jgi:hypothetical protein
MSQVVDHLPTKRKPLSSNPITARREKTKQTKKNHKILNSESQHKISPEFP